MAFIRRVRTNSGATEVQIAEYSQGKQHILQHLGSAHTEADLGLLLEQARSLIVPAQDTLDLDLRPQSRTEHLRQAPTGQSQLYSKPTSTGTHATGPAEAEAGTEPGTESRSGTEPGAAAGHPILRGSLR